VKQHRYERIATALARRIASGKASIGDTLPTEAELCHRYGVSRYTAREAMRSLREAGLVTRRRRAGTRVAAASRSAAFTVPVGSANELFRYASDIRLVIEERCRIRADAATAPLLGCRRGQSWIRLTGIRREPGKARPVCVIRVYLNSVLSGIERKVPATGAVIFPIIEREFGIRVTWIGQKIEAQPLAAGDAARLGSAPGACGLRVRRYYYDANERLLQVSDSIHAAERFAYEMRWRRE